MSIYTFFRISKPSQAKVPPEKVDEEYKRLRRNTFWGVTAAYSLYYFCRIALSAVKQPLIDDAGLTTAQLGIISSAFMFVYAVGKFINGFIADYCNIRRFMAAGLLISSILNILLGAVGMVPLLSGSISSCGTTVMFLIFVVFWGVNGWMQSMGPAPGVISLSRWFPLNRRGTMYSIFSSTPYIGKALTMISIGYIVNALGWQWGFIASGIAGLMGVATILLTVHDTPQSEGLPSVQDIARETTSKSDKMPTRELQKMVFRHPGIWVIALSSAFIYITQYAVSGWGVLFLQKVKSFSFVSANQIVGGAEAFGIAGTVLAGWLSDTLFRGDRVKPVLISGILCLAALAAFLFTGGSYIVNVIYIAVFTLSIGIVFCIVAGLMALDFVPRKATGAALGIVGISSYVAAGLQDIATGFLIKVDASADVYNFTTVSIFWLTACLLSFLLPVLGWKYLSKN